MTVQRKISRWNLYAKSSFDTVGTEIPWTPDFELHCYLLQQQMLDMQMLCKNSIYISIFWYIKVNCPNLSPPVRSWCFWGVNKSDFVKISLCGGILLHSIISLRFFRGEIFIHSMKFKFGINLNSSASQMRKIMISQILNVLTRYLFTKCLRNRNWNVWIEHKSFCIEQNGHNLCRIIAIFTHIPQINSLRY